MRNLFEKAVENGHLKYGGRQQLGLFFKSIGLPLEDAVQVWRRLFSSKISSTDEFNKTYLYNIRHNYGQEGKRANYGPTPCNRIILGTAPGLGEYHGCPFRHLGEKKLPELLSKYHGPSGLRPSENQVSEILAIASGGSRCQAACTRLLEVTREMPCTLKESFVTPTQFFEHSVKLSKKKSLRSSHSAVKDEILGTR